MPSVNAQNPFSLFKSKDAAHPFRSIKNIHKPQWQIAQDLGYDIISRRLTDSLSLACISIDDYRNYRL